MIKRFSSSPFKLTTHFRGWTRVLALSLGISLLLNFALVYANAKQAANLSTPRIVMRTSSGIVLPIAASAFVWTPEVARDYIKIFLPIIYTWSPVAGASVETWSPFISPLLLKNALESYRQNLPRIQSDSLNQTLLVREVLYDPENDTAGVIGELRLIDRAGHVTTTPLKITVDLITSADPLNPYGHAINNIH
ncbi:MAG: hypothetical protein PHV34_19130 [Verrucomicrobiae bacterium]|nr:hypothetical protein [Verrucomicrobiae bacterium]